MSYKEYMVGISRNQDQRRFSGTATIKTTITKGDKGQDAVKKEVFNDAGELVATFWADNPAIWCEANGFTKVVYG